jgi:hypothetical protein
VLPRSSSRVGVGPNGLVNGLDWKQSPPYHHSYPKTRILIEAPLIEMDKADIVREGIRLKVKFSKTYTCYSGENMCDANSPSSALRIKGFANAGYIDPLPYRQDLTKIWEKYKCRLIDYDTYNN